jgi:uncharacterized protein YutD
LVSRGGDVEKLRKPLEKRTTSFSTKKQNFAEVVNKFQYVFGDVSVGSKLAGPFAGGMEDTDQLHNIAANTIRNYVGRSRDN